jgi:hypothetical protein
VCDYQAGPSGQEIPEYREEGSPTMNIEKAHHLWAGIKEFGKDRSKK